MLIQIVVHTVEVVQPLQLWRYQHNDNVTYNKQLLIMALDHEAIYSAHSDVVSIDDGQGAFDKDGKSVTIDSTKVAAARKALDDAAAAIKYKSDRAEAFASVGDQLDMQYWDKKNGTTTWVDHVAKVKADHPKP